MLPFVLAHPSRSIHAVRAVTELEAAETRVMAFLQHRGIDALLMMSETTLPGPTGCWEKTWVSSPLTTSLTVLPEPDTSPDSQEDEKLEHSNNDDTSSPD